MVRKKPKELVMHTFDKYEVWWTDHISHNQWKTITDALHISNSDPAILGLIKHHLQKAGISNLGILDVDLSKFKMIAGSK